MRTYWPSRRMLSTMITMLAALALVMLPLKPAYADVGANFLSVSDPTVTEGNAGTATLSFAVTLDAPDPDTTITVDYATSDGTATQPGDYTSASGTLTFAPTEVSKTVDVTVNADVLDEANETVTLTLSNEVDASITDGTGTGTITDDDATPSLSVNDPEVVEGDSGTVNLTYTVTLSAASGQTVAVDYATADGTASSASDYDAATNTLTYTPGQTSKTVDVVVNGDATSESHEAVLLNLSNVSNATIADAQGSGLIKNDDGANVLSIADRTLAEGNSGTTTAQFVVSLSAVSASPITVDWATADATAVDSADYVAGTATLTFAPGEYQKTISVLVNGDTTDEINETFEVNLSNESGATVIDAQGIGTITDDDAAPSISISDPSVTEGNSGTTTLNYTVTLSVASGQTVTADWATADGTATDPADYASGTGTVTFTPGDVNETVAVVVNGDTLDEANETILVDVTNPSNATISDAQGSGTITDDDGAPSISISDPTVTEGNSGTTTLTYTVTLSTASGQTVTADWATADGTATDPADYVSDTGTVTFTAGDVSETVSVVVNGDTLDEANETVLVDLTSPSNATISDAQGSGTITDDDAAPSVSISDPSVTEGNSGTATLTYTVTLSTASGQTVTVDWASADGTAGQPTDYASDSNTVTFTPGDVSETVSILVNGDTTNEANETVLVNLSNPSNATISDTQGVGTITNDDAVPSISIDNPSVTEGNSGTATLTYTVTLSAASGQTVTVDWASADGTATDTVDYVGDTGTSTFTAGDTTESIVIVVNGDVLDEANETILIDLTSPSNATISDAQGSGSITDDDASPSISISDPTVTEGNSGTATLTYVVTLSTASGQTATASYATADGTATQPGDYTSGSGTVTFTAGDVSENISVSVVGDTTDEVNETVLVNLTSPSNATISDAQGSGTITDDDGAPSLSVNDPTVTEGNSGTTTLTYTVTLSPASGQTVTVDYATANNTASQPGDYTAASGTLTYTPGQTSKTVAVTVVGDTADEANETISLTLSNVSNATIADALGSGTITDDDATPSLSVDDPSVVEGDSGTVTLTFTVTLSAVSGQTVAVGYATANGTASQPGDYTAASGTLTYTPGQTSKAVAVTVNGDTVDEAAETVLLNLSSASNATIADTQGSGTITADDASATPADPDATEETVSGGGTVETEDDPTADDPIAVGTTTPNAGTVTIEESTSTSFTFAGVDVLPFEVMIDAPAASTGDPLVLSFRLSADSLTAGGLDLATAMDRLVVFSGGTALENCTGAGAVPDPCVASVTESGGIVTVVVRASQSEFSGSEVGANTVDIGVWNFGISSNNGYRLVASDGGVFAYGDSEFLGSTGSITLNKPIVGSVSTPTGEGYWLVASDGGVFAYGDAEFFGSTGSLRLNKPIVGIASTPSGNGYWLVASDGGVFAYGDAGFYGSTGSITLNKPIVGIASTPSGNGYWLVASDGGVFAYGDAVFYGSTGSATLNKPIIGMAVTESGNGYWLIASDGGVFAYGDAVFYGSTGSQTLNKPIVGIKATASGEGYYLVASDGGVFSYGDAEFAGSTGDLTLNKPIVSIN